MRISRIKDQFLKGLLLGVFLLSSVNATLVDPSMAALQPDHLSSVGLPASIAGCELFPENNYWNTPIDTLPVHASSAAWVNSIGASNNFHMDFGSGTWDGGPIGIPYNIVSGSTVTNYTVNFEYWDESDPGPYPIPSNPLREWGDDHHILIVDTDDCTLYELYAASKSGGQWSAGSGAIWDLSSNALRPNTWTSADAAGLPILPGLARYEEVVAGEIDHALRFTASQTAGFIWPARHQTSDPQNGIPPMGARFRLKADYDISGFNADMQVILRAMKKYGIVLADNGSNWYVSGVPNEGWDNDNPDMLHSLDVLEGSDFEAVDTSAMMMDPDSGATYNLPLVEGIVRVNANPTNASSVNFTVTFDRNVSGVGTSDFALTTSGVLGATVSGISGSGSSYTVTVNTGSGDGSIRLDLVDDNSILDDSLSPLGGPGLNDGNFAGEAYTIDRTAPVLLSIHAMGSNPGRAAVVNFLVTFSEPVLNVDISNFALVSSQLTGASLTTVSGSGATRQVTVRTGSGDGTIGLNFSNNNTITDLATNSIGTASFTGQVFDIDKPDIAAPMLRSPGNGKSINDATPTFLWRSIAGGQTYEIEIATDPAFAAIVHTNNGPAASYTSPALADGTYYWHVRTYNSSNQPGVWSVARSFTLDTIGPAAPVLIPAVSSSRPTLKWQTSVAAVAYEVQVDNDADFSSQIFHVVFRGTSRRMPVTPAGTYYWHVRAQDALGNWGPWSPSAMVTIP